MLFSFLGALFGVINVATNPINSLPGPTGLYVWNIAAGMWDHYDYFVNNIDFMVLYLREDSWFSLQRSQQMIFYKDLNKWFLLQRISTNESRYNDINNWFLTISCERSGPQLARDRHVGCPVQREAEGQRDGQERQESSVDFERDVYYRLFHVVRLYVFVLVSNHTDVDY